MQYLTTDLTSRKQGEKKQITQPDERVPWPSRLRTTTHATIVLRAHHLEFSKAPCDSIEELKTSP